MNTIMTTEEVGRAVCDMLGIDYKKNKIYSIKFNTQLISFPSLVVEIAIDSEFFKRLQEKIDANSQ